MKNLGNLMRQAQEMQAKMGEMQAKLAEITVDGASGGGLVKATVTGKGELKKLKIDPKLIDPNEIEMLEDLIIAACNDARLKSETMAAEEMKKLTGGLNLPPGMKLPF